MPEIIRVLIADDDQESLENIKNILPKESKIEVVQSTSDAVMKTIDRSKIISFFSPKGGVGKSMLAVNAAIALNQITKEKVAVIDFDLQFGDVALFLNICSEINMHHLIYDLENGAKASIEKYLTAHSSGVKVLPAPYNEDDIEAISAEQVKKILSLFFDYQYIIVDMSSAMNSMNLALLEASHKIFLVTTLELTAIKNTMMMLNSKKASLYSNKKIDVILNRHEGNHGISLEELENIIDKRNLFIVPENKSCVLQSVNSGQPFILNRKKLNIHKSLIEIAQTISNPLQNEIERWKKSNDVNKKYKKRAIY